MEKLLKKGEGSGEEAKMKPEHYRLIRDLMKEAWDASKKPGLSISARDQLRSLVNRAGDVLRRATKPEDWLCTGEGCGKRPFQDGPGRWRWDGENWQHHHEYPVGHVHAEYKPKEAL
jgi:hypothetical protein